MAVGRGELFERRIELACRQYEEQGIAMIHRTEGKWRGTSRGKAYLSASEKGMPDFLGSHAGQAVAIEAKSTARKSWELRNWKPEQVERMRKHREQGAQAWILLEWQFANEVYRIPFVTAYEWWKESVLGGRKSVPYSEMSKGVQVKEGRGVTLDFLI
ncbi:Holliday junction resolvase RecU [Ectobacillus antri]|uniref:Holliday junction resolvase RecU n=1 Tax=Ectobacillus antri TaxID=2486280 RepID=UPI000F591E34|nr:Holliday junction resolvase RecU [Ectobacillus antri]